LAEQPLVTTTDNPSSTSSFRTWKWVAGGAAITALVMGGWLLATDGSSCPAQSSQECRPGHDTGLAGMATFTTGLGLAAASAWMFYRDRDGAAVGASAGASGNGVGAALIGQF
jgi:hypothetical protein